MKEIGTLIFLAVNSWKDWKYREISLVLTGIYGVVGMGYSFWQSRSLYDFMIPAAIAVLFLILSVITAGEIGLGDGWILLALGQMLYTTEYIRMLSIGLILTAVYGAVLLAAAGKSKKTEIPLVPFLLLGYMGGFFL